VDQVEDWHVHKYDVNPMERIDQTSAGLVVDPVLPLSGPPQGVEMIEELRERTSVFLGQTWPT
jgi:hypothetical protein